MVVEYVVSNVNSRFVPSKFDGIDFNVLIVELYLFLLVVGRAHHFDRRPFVRPIGKRFISDRYTAGTDLFYLRRRDVRSNDKIFRGKSFIITDGQNVFLAVFRDSGIEIGGSGKQFVFGNGH